MQEYLTIFLTTYSKTLLDAGYKIILAVIVLLLGKAVAKLAKKSIKKLNIHFHTLDATLIPIFSTIAGYLVYVIALLIILDIFGANTSSIIALLGAAGLAIGLALKDTLSHIAAGIMLIVLRPINVGDFIECGVISGRVQEIGLFVTVLKTPDGVRISSPNSFLWSGNIKNFTRNGTRRMDIVIHITSADVVDCIIDKLNGIISEEQRFLEEPAPKIMVQSTADSTMDIHLRAWANVDDYWTVYWDTNKKINERIREAKQASTTLTEASTT